MPGFWEKILDYFTRVDDILREIKEEYIKGNKQLIEAVTGVEVPEEPEIPRRHIPFYVEGSLTAGQSVTLLVKDDDEQGLGAVGRSGSIRNDSTTDSLYVIIDDGKGKSKEIDVARGEALLIDRYDDIWIDKLTLSCTTGTVSYRCLFSR